jgi:transposase
LVAISGFRPESARISGFDAYKRVKGRKRHLLVDTLGIPLSYYVTPADVHETQGGRRLLGGLKYSVPRLKTIWADSAYRGKDLADWCKAVGGWDLEVVGHVPRTKGFAGRPKRWIVERYLLGSYPVRLTATEAEVGWLNWRLTRQAAIPQPCEPASFLMQPFRA